MLISISIVSNGRGREAAHVQDWSQQDTHKHTRRPPCQTGATLGGCRAHDNIVKMSGAALGGYKSHEEEGVSSNSTPMDHSQNNDYTVEKHVCSLAHKP